MRAYDPVAMPESRRRMADLPIRYAQTMYEAAGRRRRCGPPDREWKELRMPRLDTAARRRGTRSSTACAIFDKPEVEAAEFLLLPNRQIKPLPSGLIHGFSVGQFRN